jgi:hypothetical protein
MEGFGKDKIFIKLDTNNTNPLRNTRITLIVCYREMYLKENYNSIFYIRRFR